MRYHADQSQIRRELLVDERNERGYIDGVVFGVIMGTGVPRVIISGRLVYGWKFITTPLNDAIRRSIVGSIDGWSVEAGSPTGSALGGALEVAVEEFLNSV